MFSIKLKARRMSHGRKAAATLFFELRLLAGLSAAVCFLSAAFLPFGGRAPVAFGVTLPVPVAAAGLTAAGALFLLFDKTAKAGLFDYLPQPDPAKDPISFLSLRRGARQLAGDALVFARSVCLLLLLCLPAAVSFLCVTALTFSALLPVRAIRTGLLLSGAQVGAALVAFAVLRQQYAMTGFFLRRFPRLSPAKALSRSREAVRRRPWLLPEMRLHTLGWRLFGALGVSIPFVLTYTALTDQLCQQRIFEKS